MNRNNYITKVKPKVKPKPSFVPNGINIGDRVRGLKRIYTNDGYYEVGHEFLIVEITRVDKQLDTFLVCPLADDDYVPDKNHWCKYIYCECAFELVEKDWIDNPRHKWNQKK